MARDRDPLTRLTTSVGGLLSLCSNYNSSAAPWLAQYLHEMTTFHNGRHDDQVDSTAQMLDRFKHGSGLSSNAGIFELYRQRAEQLRQGQAPSP